MCNKNTCYGPLLKKICKNPEKKGADWKFGCLPIRPNLQPTPRLIYLLYVEIIKIYFTFYLILVVFSKYSLPLTCQRHDILEKALWFVVFMTSGTNAFLFLSGISQKHLAS